MFAAVLPVSDVGAAVAKCLQRARAKQGRVLDRSAAQRSEIDGDGAAHNVAGIEVGFLADLIAGRADHVGVVAGAAFQRVVADAAIERVMAPNP